MGSGSKLSKRGLRDLVTGETVEYFSCDCNEELHCCQFNSGPINEEAYLYLMVSCYSTARCVSRDTSTQNCAALANELGSTDANWNQIIGYNHKERFESPLKYQWTEHAERNVIYSMVSRGKSTKGTTMVCPWAACSDCARAIVQSGISTLVRHKEAMNRECGEMWKESIAIGDQILKEGFVEIIELEGKIMPDDFFIRFNGELWSP